MPLSDAFIAAVRRRLHPELHPNADSELGSDSSPLSPSPSPSPTAERPRVRPRSPSQELTPSKVSSRIAVRPPIDIDVDDVSFPKNTNKKTRLDVDVSKAPSRVARYRPVPSKSVLDRRARSQRHRLHLVARSVDAAGTHGKFVVMGVNGNVYTCHIAVEPTCDCPDFIARAGGNGNVNKGPCKHLIFVLLRVLNVHVEDPVWWQIRLLPDEVKRVLTTSHSNNNYYYNDRSDILAEQGVRDMYQQQQREKDIAIQLQGKNRNTNNYIAEKSLTLRQAACASSSSSSSNECPICFELICSTDDNLKFNLNNTQKTVEKGQDVLRCANYKVNNCERQFHPSCYLQWSRHHQNQNQNQNQSDAKHICPVCTARAGDVIPGPSGSTGVANTTPHITIISHQGGHRQPQQPFANFAHLSSAHAVPMTLAQLYAETHQYIGRGRRGNRRSPTPS